ncbi:helicase C-terminal domain-domain-containing protein [Clohesyomyces aquaticus]|uniref:ATP-dependent DNA helicase CHL1 n=1 Tax=Clohesyomyces aquaticus TaxID=1231657 RepID=A0A1Y1YSN4_9PLEO|nr:helicase C-terminal domain-domain-containing protein [Clohesyomyces aquaticus]
MDGNPEREFHHPFEPYDIQKDFMNAVYDCLEDGKVGIFESPTGTGKSLSLICGSLTWLRDHKRRAFREGFAADRVDEDEPTWMIEHARQQKKQAAVHRRQEMEFRIAKIKEKEKRAKERHQNGEPRFKRQKVASDLTGLEDANEARFILDEYESDRETNPKTGPAAFDESGLSAETQALMEKFGYSLAPKKQEEDVVDELKIFFCSRTHSQLTQFSSELNRVRMPPAIKLDPPEGNKGDDDLVEDVKHLTLGSRKNLCINLKVNKLGNATAINERCLELQQPGKSTDSKCPFMPSKETETLVNDFRDHALAKIRDIEDLGVLGKKLGICPYYASRPATKFCEKSAREALDLSLKDHVVIIDEAHNLMDAIAGIYSVSVSLAQVQLARAQLTVYLQKFRNRLKGKNRVYVAQTVRVLDSVASYLQLKSTEPKVVDGVVNMGDLMSGKGVDQINMFKLNRYLQESRLARKVDGYTVYAEQSGNQEGEKKLAKRAPRQSVPVLTHVQSFLLSLMNPSAEGRFFFAKEDSNEMFLKYMLLDPTFHFKDIIEEARAVVLAGGTMSPMSDYQQHLLSYLDSSKIMTLSCGHVIPPSNLLAIPVVKTLSGVDFDFTFDKRKSERMMIDLGSAILGFAQHIPDGVVIFFPSYSYLDSCIAAWKRTRPTATPGSISFWDAMNNVKPIFLEQKSQHQPVDSTIPPKASTADSVLDAYSNAIAFGNGCGALLFAVIGGTLSEGINFSDALGRGVVVVGLPFPNPHSAEWKAKMQYISSKASSNGQDGKAAARDFYENACMRAVNQTVGRAIRHRGDYAAILMLDRRYSGERIQAKLPGWVRGSLASGAGVSQVVSRLDEFFAGKCEELGAYTTVAQTEDSTAELTAHGKEVESPTPDELATLRRVADKLPWTAFLVAIVELCERFAYYGLSGPFQNYMSNKWHDPNGLPGAIGLKQSGATALSNFFQFWCYVTPIVGAVVADQYLGKYLTIKYFSLVYMFGIFILFITSLPISIEHGWAFPGLIFSMFIIGLGTGGIKSNVSPLIAEQVRTTKPFVKLLSSGKRVIVDPELTVQRIYMVFYMCINVGSLSAIVTTNLELHVGFWSAYLLPLLMFSVGYCILVSGKDQYVIRPPQGGVIGNCFKALWIAMRNRFDLDKAKPSLQEMRASQREYKISWDDKFIDELKTALVACKVFAFFPIYWLVFSQMMNNFVSQAGQMELHGVPNDILQNIDPLTIIILIPVLDRLVYPFLRSTLHLAMTPITRITWGFFIASAAMAYAAYLQSRIYSAGPCFTSPSRCEAGKIAGTEGQYEPNRIHVAWQAPSYILIAISEVLASITGLELAYSKAPANMKSFIMSLFLLTSAGGSALGILLAPSAKDPDLVWLYAALAGMSLLAGGLFHIVFKGVDRVEEEPRAVETAEGIEMVERKSDEIIVDGVRDV